ncbi:hypothetical protein C5471_20660 [Photorhabdus tasmaniensis]|uniref:Uncharacterized protein n=1 Tax=Photorhabdus tasmaniensis TaxID=1004159 RepID=A0ABX0GLJ0_9GAMM|nr:hypothetical protein [Photorhabdus tasmaniensis]
MHEDLLTCQKISIQNTVGASQMFEGYLRNTKLNLFDMEENLVDWARYDSNASLQTLRRAFIASFGVNRFS